MAEMKIECNWTIEGPLHIGTGISRKGYADAIIRRDAAGNEIILPGDAVKGAVRQSAELLVRWLMLEGAPKLDRLDSFPNHPVIRRIFAPGESGPLYRFGTATASGGEKMCVASTAIDPETGMARDNSLRIVENGAPRLVFRVVVQGCGGRWDDSSSYDHADLIFLAGAVLATEGVGGKKGIGLGKISVSELCCRVGDSETFAPDWSIEQVRMLRKHVEHSEHCGPV